MFEKIDDSVFREAGQVIDAVHGGKPRDAGYLPNLSTMVAGAALVLEKGAPNMFFESQETKAERYIQQGTNEWRMMHGAVARVIAIDARDQTFFEHPEDLIRHMVADVSHQAKYSKVKSAIDIPDLIERVPQELRPVVDHAMGRNDAISDVVSHATGSYDALPIREQASIQTELRTGSALSPELSASLKRMTHVMEVSSEEEMRHLSSPDPRNDHVVELEAFRPIPVDAVKKVDDLLVHGVSTGDVALDAGLRAHEAISRVPQRHDAMSNIMGVDSSDPEALIARARAVDDVEKGMLTIDAGGIARRIEADRLVMVSAMRDVQIYDRPEDRSRAVGAYHALPRNDQIVLESNLALAVNVPTLTGLRMDDAIVPKRDAAPAMNARRHAILASQGIGI